MVSSGQGAHVAGRLQLWHDRRAAQWEAFDDFVGCSREAGIDEFVLGYMPGLDAEDLVGGWIMNRDTLQETAARVLSLTA